MMVVNDNRRKLSIKLFHIENTETQKSCFPIYAALQLWDMVKAAFREQLTALNAFNRKHKNVKTNESSCQFRKPEKENKINPEKIEGCKDQSRIPSRCPDPYVYQVLQIKYIMTPIYNSICQMDINSVMINKFKYSSEI